MLPVEHNDPINAKILAIAEDKIEGFVAEPFEEIANRSGVPVEVVMARIAAMLRAGTIRRVRQTLLATNCRRNKARRRRQAAESIPSSAAPRLTKVNLRASSRSAFSGLFPITVR